MARSRVVLDTNVLVSGLLSPLGPPGQLVDRVVAGEVVLLVDARIIAEYENVLRRPRLALPVAAVALVLRAVERFGEVVAARPVPGLVLPDASDLPFVEAAAAGAADALVTGNARHFVPVRGSHAVPVLSPRTFLDGLEER